MLRDEILAIVGGYHPDPFRVLGPHQVKDEDGKALHWEVRAFHPKARQIVLVTHGRGEPMEALHDDGFFVATLDHAPGHYMLEIHFQDGHSYRTEDAYRFPPLLTGYELHLHAEGTLYEGWKTFGAHLATCDGVSGVRFAVWAPEAYLVSVVGDFNDWDPRRNPMRLRESGVWEIFVPHVETGVRYKYYIQSKHQGARLVKADPYGFYAEVPPATASVVAALDSYEWNDAAWMTRRAEADVLHEPMSVYEVHLESWMRHADGRPLSYRELADKLIPYVKEIGFTHIELLPILEHPFSGSWGYQVVGFFAPTSRFGSPDDFKYFVDRCHQEGIGVILDWVPAHYPKDAHGLAFFDGSALYEHGDSRKGEHRDWGTLIFNYGRHEVRSFLISSAMFWLREYHLDGLRVDAVASMLYLDYSRNPGDWVPNIYGGNENLEAIDFLKRFNEAIHTVPGAVSIAEESTSFAGVSRPTYSGGLGFTFKWNMGWMHDMLAYFSRDPIHRKYHQNNITFSMLYAFQENFMLPISHDEVVHGKASLIGKMPGDEWQRFANARAFLGYMWTHPGKKLLFMGCEIGQYEEWNYATQLRWGLLEYDYHRKLLAFVRELNRLYQSEPALYEVDYQWDGFEWLDFTDMQNSTISFLRWSKQRGEALVVICNFTPQPRPNYRIGVPFPGRYRELLNSDSAFFGGSNMGNGGAVEATTHSAHNRPYSLVVTLPPLGVLVFKPDHNSASLSSDRQRYQQATEQ